MTDKTKEVLRLALRALEYIDLTDNDRDFLQPHECYMLDEAITAIRSALALVNKVDQEESSGTEQPAIKQDLTPEQPAPVAEPRKPQQEPVAWMDRFGEVLPKEVVDKLPTDIPLYTPPPSLSLAQCQSRSDVKPWVGLTDEDYEEVEEWVGHVVPEPVLYAIEAKLKAKNSP